MTVSLADRFWAKVNVRGAIDCWLWTASTKNGYGQFGVSRGKNLLAHRLAYALVHGPIPPMMCVLHVCDTPRCVNPRHLRLGTRADDNADCRAKGRHAMHPENLRYGPGEKNAAAKLTAIQVQEIRRLAAQGRSQRFIATQFSVTTDAISLIVLRHRWAHV